MRKIAFAFLVTAILSTSHLALAAVNVNQADAQTIAKELKGIGKAKAEAIVQERKKNGPFKDGADLAKRVKGIGPATIAKNKNNILFK